MKSRLNFVHFLLLCLLILAVGLIFVYKRGSSKYEDLLKNERQQTGILSAKIDSLTSLISGYKMMVEFPFKLDSWKIAQLKIQGLSDPINDIIADLSKHNELIPFKGVLGGTMGFYDLEDIIVTSNEVFAPFDDGHIVGYMLLKYQVSSEGKISWKVLDAYLK
jgi:hypothetical protein